ncbi:hypothetical protein SLS53_004507 [Cytospora paraplurivora]|uniref:FAD-binding PCMH-type domain-containing protein n=1 Tax=Cytospora paraplurivora TaxID=2898453 RepID=A0AAN9UGD0_9PEZI
MDTISGFPKAIVPESNGKPYIEEQQPGQQEPQQQKQQRLDPATHHDDNDDLPILYRDSTPRDEFLAAVWGHVFNQRQATEARVPRAVVHATSTRHVLAAVRLANELGCRVSVRSGGHSWAGWSVREDAICVDLGGLPGGKYSLTGGGGDGHGAAEAGVEYEYDEETKVLSCPPSATGRMVNGFLEGKGRMFAGGHCPDVGLGGFLLQGGMGWNCKNWGWSCESVLGIDAVTADGREVHASPAENTDLFWAARGAGPAFKPNRTSGEAALRPIHDDPNRPPNPIIQTFAEPTSLPDQYAPQAIANPEGHRYCSENAYVRNDEDVPAVLEEAFTTLPTRKAFALYFGMAPTSRRAHYTADADDDAASMALSMHSDHYFALYTVWEDAVDDERCVDWTHRVIRRVERFAEGSYLGDSDFRYRRTKFWRDGNARRLMGIRRKWDPEGRVCGYLDEGDQSGVEGLRNEFEWE